jgi:hypothetical protein
MSLGHLLADSSGFYHDPPDYKHASPLPRREKSEHALATCPGVRSSLYRSDAGGLNGNGHSTTASAVG